ncbi:cytochrome c oxidase subunit 3 [Chondromyces crocatus]|uniref:Cytochrome C oxidase subunit III n=1 Tax=Chondromyces crocatus TaxID=52 RepID=A0A0K1EMU3_CHOCO|nr:cytochrome c oxidase subunit 3 [Chondromyces crocatus]AKT42141.1 cytochrome C oxidase subunit III [Chondromyces crocatus]
MPASRLAEHFEDLEKQTHAARLGMWIFLGSETLLFGALFGLYGAYRAMYPEAFAAAAAHNSIWIGSINTVVLITSSLTVALAVVAVRANLGRRAGVLLLVSLLFGVTFLVLKGMEYADHIHHGILPGSAYHFHELPSAGANRFFSLYYLLTGLHALHVIAGMIFLGAVSVGCFRGRYDNRYHTPVELGGLYWHLIDIIWIFLWPLLYLTRP